MNRLTEKIITIGNRVPVPPNYPTINNALSYLQRIGYAGIVELKLKVTTPTNPSNPGWVYIIVGGNVTKIIKLLRKWDGR